MNGKMTVQRRSLCTWAAMAAGFRTFYAVIIDGRQLFGSAWISVLAAVLLFAPVGGALIAMRKMDPSHLPEEALEAAGGRWGRRLVGVMFAVVLIYDAGAVVSLMSGTAKYVAMPEANRILIRAVTAAAATVAVLMGAAAAAGAAVLWRRLTAVLIVLLIGTQMRYFRPEWLSPLFGPGIAEIGKNAIPAAGMLTLSAGGWLMLEPEHDRKGSALLRCIVRSGLIASALSLMFGMLVPGMLEETPTRSFRIGRLLANDRAGLTLEMPYVVLLYSGMYTMLVFELAASVKAIGLIFPRMNIKWTSVTVGFAAFLLSVSPWAERDVLRVISVWYYPLIALPLCLMGAAAWIRRRKAGKAV